MFQMSCLAFILICSPKLRASAYYQAGAVRRLCADLRFDDMHHVRLVLVMAPCVGDQDRRGSPVSTLFLLPR